MTQLLPNIWAVRVPKDVDGNTVEINYSGDKLVFWEDGGSIELEITPGNYSIIGVGISEEVAGKIVGKVGEKTWKDYEYGTGKSQFPFYFSAIQSLISLLKSKGLNTEDTYVFLKLND